MKTCENLPFDVFNVECKQPHNDPYILIYLGGEGDTDKSICLSMQDVLHMSTALLSVMPSKTKESM